MISDETNTYLQENWYSQEEIVRINSSLEQINNWNISSFEDVINEVKEGKSVNYV